MGRKLIIYLLFLFVVISFILITQGYYSKEYYKLFLDSERHFVVSENIIKDRIAFLEKEISKNESAIARDERELKIQIAKTSSGGMLNVNGKAFKAIDSSVLHLIKNELGLPLLNELEMKKKEVENLKKEVEVLSLASIEKNGTLPRDKEIRKQLLNQQDFEYFSWGAATSNSYGDIYPLSSKTRDCVRRQIILSIILFALGISLLFNVLCLLVDALAQPGFIISKEIKAKRTKKVFRKGCPFLRDI